MYRFKKPYFKSITIAFLILSISCGEEEGGSDDEVDGGTDTDIDTDADSDTDSDTDTDADSGTDAGTDTDTDNDTDTDTGNVDEYYQWHAFYGSGDFDYGNDMKIATNGDLIIVGSSSSTWNGPDGELPLYPYPGNPFYAPFILNYPGFRLMGEQAPD